MIIKSPPVYDVSHWKIVPDFALVSPRPTLVLTKATEHTSYVDSTFVKYFEDLKQDGIARGAYHFFRKAYNAVKQAEHFVETTYPHANEKDILVLDIEEGGETASQMWAWFETVRIYFPQNLLMLYSRKNILDPIPMTFAEKEYFKKIPVWTAGYPYFPDLYSRPPVGYIPDQSKYGAVWLWQYTSSGRVTGISGDTDCNWIDPVLYAMIQNTAPAPTTPTRTATINFLPDGTLTGTWRDDGNA